MEIRRPPQAAGSRGGDQVIDESSSDDMDEGDGPEQEPVDGIDTNVKKILDLGFCDDIEKIKAILVKAKNDCDKAVEMLMEDC